MVLELQAKQKQQYRTASLHRFAQRAQTAGRQILLYAVALELFPSGNSVPEMSDQDSLL
jgi:hypothetical protein